MPVSAAVSSRVGVLNVDSLLLEHFKELLLSALEVYKDQETSQNQEGAKKTPLRRIATPKCDKI